MACVIGHFDLIGIHPDGVFGAGFHAETAETAAADIDQKLGWIFLYFRIWVFCRFYVDTFRGTDSRTQHTSDTSGFPVFSFHQPVQTSVSGGDVFLFLWVLDGHGSPFLCLDTHDLKDVENHVDAEVASGDHTAPYNFYEIS